MSQAADAGRPMAPRTPSGEQVTLRAAGGEVTVVTAGGGIREYTHEGRPLLDGYTRESVADGGRGQLLVPWPNRIAGGSYEFAGQSLQLALTEPDRGHAIHGLARWMPWRIEARDEARALLALELPPQPGYPFCLDLAVEYRLDGGGLTVRQTAVNVGPRPCPYAAGCHPYLTAGSVPVDGSRLEVPAATALVMDHRMIPTGRTPVTGTELDFRGGRSIGGARLDTAYTDLQRDGDGIARVTLRGPERAVQLWVDTAHPYLMVFTGDTLEPARRRQGLAVEPMTAAPNAFRSGDGLRVLQPGELFSSTWGIGPVAG